MPLRRLQLSIPLGLFTLVFLSCAPSIQYTGRNSSKPAKSEVYNIIVYTSDSILPANSVILGNVYIGDSGLSVGCGYDVVINLAKRKARQVGGDAIQITEVKTPDILSTCYRIRANIIAFEEIRPPSNWPITKKSELDIKRFLDQNIENLNPIEGIWTLNEGGTWRNITTGESGEIPNTNTYRLAILRNKAQANNYDFVVIVLESEYPHWKPGYLKAYFRKTAYERVFDGLWYMNDFSEIKGNYVFDESGLLKNFMTTYRNNLELKHESVFLKAYPPFSGKFVTSDPNAPQTAGSGFLVSTAGLVVTNLHVVKDAKKIEVFFPEKSIKKSAKIQIKDSQNDLVILKLEDFSYTQISNTKVPFILASDINSVKVGQEVITLGFPLGDIMGSTPRLSTGLINSEFGLQDDPTLFQISNPIQPGNSGGPLFNRKGELVGIVVSGLNAKYFYENAGIVPQNVNFAIKANYLKNVLSMLPEGQEIVTRMNSVKQSSLEEQIQQLKPFIVQIKTF